LKESLDGMAQQLADKKEAEAKKQEAVDGFKSIRMHDLLLHSHKPHGLVHHSKEPPASGPSRNLLMAAEKPLPTKQALVPQVDVLTKQGKSKVTQAVFSRGALGKGFSTNDSMIQNLEHLISQQRQNFSNTGPCYDRASRHSSVVIENSHLGMLSVSSFKSWAAAQVLLRDQDFTAAVEGDEIRFSLNCEMIHENERQKELFPGDGERGQDAVSKKLCLPPRAPFPMVVSARKIASAYLSARDSFEHAARRKVQSVLHPGGWIIGKYRNIVINIGK